MNEKKITIPSPAPVLVMFTLALMAVIQLFFPELIHPGLTLTIIGIVFLGLYFGRWIRDPLTLILGWMLSSFGLSYWAASQTQWSAASLPLILTGLGLGFVAIYVTAASAGMLESQASRWPLVPAMMLMVVAAIMVLEGLVGRQRLWSVVVPLIPAVTAIWYMMEWRRAVDALKR